MFKHLWRALGAAGVSLLLAACGGGSQPTESATVTESAATQLRQRALSHIAAQAQAPAQTPAAAVAPEAAIEQLFDFAEAQFPQFFPSRQATRSSEPFLYRHYPETGVYIGVAVTPGMGYQQDGLYVMGGALGSSPSYVGQIGALLDFDRDGVANADDAVPLDGLCFMASDAFGGECHLRAMAGMRVRVVGNSAGKLIFSAEGDSLLLYAYDLKSRQFMGRTVMTGFTPTAYAYAPEHGRVYVGDTAGTVHAYTEALAKSAAPLTRLGRRVAGLAAAGKFVFAHDFESTYVFDRQGVQTDKPYDFYRSTSYEWSPTDSRLYHLSEGVSPADLQYQVIDQSTGKRSTTGDTPYHGDYSIMRPIRVNRTGTRVLLGSGDVYAAPALTWAGKVPVSSMIDAMWLANDELLVASSGEGGVRLQRYGANRVALEQLSLGAGSELLAFAHDGASNFIVARHASHVEIRSYAASNDSDGDGVDNLTDRFPLDKAAAADSDGDGHPDAWLPGRGAADSSTGLTLDAYPEDASCHAPAQGDGVSCNPALHAPVGTPDRVLTDGEGTLFLYSRERQRIYRWSAATGNYLSPLVVGQMETTGLVAAPRTIVYSPAHGRLYFGYDSGRITWMDRAGAGGEKSFGAVAMAVGGLAAAGNHLLAQDGSGAWSTHYVFDQAGALTDSRDWNYFSNYYEWAPGANRIYFFRDGSPSDLMYEEIDPLTGKIKSEGESPYHGGGYTFIGPIRVSSGGGRIALGNGDIYSTTDLTVVKALKANWTDVQWLSDGRLVGLGLNGANSRLTVYTSAFAVQREHPVDGKPLAVVTLSSGVAVVTELNGSVRVTRLTP